MRGTGDTPREMGWEWPAHSGGKARPDTPDCSAVIIHLDLTTPSLFPERSQDAAPKSRDCCTFTAASLYKTRSSPIYRRRRRTAIRHTSTR
jgi:hypothetical protein